MIVLERIILGILTIVMMQIILHSDNTTIVCGTLVIYACVFYIRGLYDK